MSATRFVLTLLPIIFSASMLIINHFAQPPTDLRPKIFVIGLSKTGTTSIGNALSMLHYRRLGWKDIGSRHLVSLTLHGDLSAALEQTRYFDAFEDLPWPLVYRDMAARFPDAKFVLSLRKDEQTWLRSMQKHMARGNWTPSVDIYGAHMVEGNEETILGVYRRHTADVRNFFADKPERYAELVIDDGDANWEVLCRVAQCPKGRVPTVEFPKSNTVADWKEGTLFSYLPWAWGAFVANVEDVVSKRYFHGNYRTVDKRVMEAMWSFMSMLDLACSNMYYDLYVRERPPLPVK